MNVKSIIITRKIIGILWLLSVTLLIVLCAIQWRDSLTPNPGWNYKRAVIIDMIWVVQFLLLGANILWIVPFTKFLKAIEGREVIIPPERKG